MKRTQLIILDGFGLGKDSPYNAVKNADAPFLKNLFGKYPHSELLTHGPSVGLPEGVMGNSEVGHSTMGAGQIIYQSLMRIHRAIEERSFAKNPVLLKVLQGKRVHLLGLLSDGGVHSHITHLKALLDLCMQLKVPQIYVHVITDGRDTPPQSGVKYLEDLLAHPSFSKNARIATIVGRYFTMDRDQRWDRIDKGYECLAGDGSEISLKPVEALKKAYSQTPKGDEFIPPMILHKEGCVRTGDRLFFFNFRADRARQISQKIMSGEKFKAAAFAGMTEYDAEFKLPVAFPAQNPKMIFPAVLAEKKLTQFRIAETEKYAHVTFFFNAGRESAFKGEDRLLIPSPKDVATYDLKPEMSAYAVAEEAVRRIESSTYDFILMNFANGDMVGHTGNYQAAIKAVETLDACLSQVIGAGEKNGYATLLTADHGNCEEMCDSEGNPHTQHTLNPVPAIWIEPGSATAPKKNRKGLKDGTLADVMPTLVEYMGLPLPGEVTGKSLLC